MSVIRKAIEPYLGYIKLAGLGIAFGLSVWAAMSAYGWAYNNGRQAAEAACMADKLALSQAAIEDLQEARAKEQAIAKKLADAAKQMGGAEQIKNTFVGFQQYLYASPSRLRGSDDRE